MVVEEVINISSETATEIISSIGTLGKWLQAIGVIAVLWIVVHTINLILNRKRIRRLDKINESLQRLEKKVNKLSKKQ